MSRQLRDLPIAFPTAVRLIAGLILLAPAALGQQASPSAAIAELKSYLPTAKSFAAEYVVVGPVPNVKAYTNRVAPNGVAAGGFESYSKSRSPYPAESRVPESDVRSQTPMTEHGVVSRTRIQVEARATGSTTSLRLVGEKLLFNEVEIDTETLAAKTPKGPLGFRSSLDQLTLPPAPHQGVVFETPRETVTKEKFLESVLVGRLTGTSTGILYYALRTPAGVQMAYVVYPLGN